MCQDECWHDAWLKWPRHIFFDNPVKGKDSFPWRLDVLRGIIYLFGDYELLYFKWCWRKSFLINLMYNMSLRVLNTHTHTHTHTHLYIMLRCLLLLKCTHLIYLQNYHSINTFNYMGFENLCKHTWIKLLKLTLSSYNKPQSKYVSHVSNVINLSPFKAFGPCIKWLLWLWMSPHTSHNEPP
jgi:hypothetical protein